MRLRTPARRRVRNERPMEEQTSGLYARLKAMIMNPDTDTIRYAAAALLDLLPADAAVGTLRRVNPGGRGQRRPCRHAPAGGPSVGAPVPAVRGGIVSRSASFELLGRAGRVTQVSAPAGSGKTFLLRSWIGAAGPGQWTAGVAVGGGGGESA